jgi:hypothetical protein
MWLRHVTEGSEVCHQIVAPGRRAVQGAVDAGRPASIAVFSVDSRRRYAPRIKRVVGAMKTSIACLNRGVRQEWSATGSPGTPEIACSPVTFC